MQRGLSVIAELLVDPFVLGVYRRLVVVSVRIKLHTFRISLSNQYIQLFIKRHKMKNTTIHTWTFDTTVP